MKDRRNVIKKLNKKIDSIKDTRLGARYIYIYIYNRIELETKTIGVTRASVSYIGGRGGDENNKYDRRDAWTRITTRSIELIESIRRVGPSCIDESALPPSLGHTDTPPPYARYTIDDSPNPVYKHSTTTPTSPAAEGWCHSYPPPPQRTSTARFHSLLRFLRDPAPPYVCTEIMHTRYIRR